MFRNILVPTDGSDLSITAALRAIPLARLAGAGMTAVFIQDTYPYTGVGEANAAGLQAFMAAARQHGLAAIQRIRDAAAQAGVAVESLVIEDHQAARGIVDAARSCDADLIVMGSHGRSGLAKLMLGSIATQVLALSPVPVMVIK
jgi:nucleotide-binding universal stress UspA family protein